MFPIHVPADAFDGGIVGLQVDENIDLFHGASLPMHSPEALVIRQGLEHLPQAGLRVGKDRPLAADGTWCRSARTPSSRRSRPE